MSVLASLARMSPFKMVLGGGSLGLLLGGAGLLLYEINTAVTIRNTTTNTGLVEQQAKTAAAEANVAPTKTTAETAIVAATAAVAPQKTQAEAETLIATAHYAELRAKAEAEKAEADAKAAQINVCKIKAETADAMGINKYDIPAFLGKDCQTLMGFNAPSK